jgi:DNA mismatch repair protein MutS
VVARARDILARLEAGRFARGEAARPEFQLTLFEPVGQELLEALERTDPETLTPLEALNLLSAWKRRFGAPPP